MGFVFKRPSTPRPPATPTIADPSVQQAADDERKRLAMARGRQSTILGGLDEAAVGSGTVQKNTLLGQ